jgi:hypothetical protein
LSWRWTRVCVHGFFYVFLHPHQPKGIKNSSFYNVSSVFKIEDMKDKHCYVSIHVGFYIWWGKRRKWCFFLKVTTKWKYSINNVLTAIECFLNVIFVVLKKIAFSLKVGIK